MNRDRHAVRAGLTTVEIGRRSCRGELRYPRVSSIRLEAESARLAEDRIGKRNSSLPSKKGITLLR